MAYCRAETTVGDETIWCERAPGHDGQHAGHVPTDGPGLTWPVYRWNRD